MILSKKIILFRLPSDLIAFVYIPLYNTIEKLNIKKVDVQFRSSVPPQTLGNKSEYNGSSEMTSKYDGPCHSSCRTPIPEHTWSKFLKLGANPNYILYNYIFRASDLWNYQKSCLTRGINWFPHSTSKLLNFLLITFSLIGF